MDEDRVAVLADIVCPYERLFRLCQRRVSKTTTPEEVVKLDERIQEARSVVEGRIRAVDDHEKYAAEHEHLERYDIRLWKTNLSADYLDELASSCPWNLVPRSMNEEKRERIRTTRIRLKIQEKELKERSNARKEKAEALERAKARREMTKRFSHRKHSSTGTFSVGLKRSE